MVHGNPMFSVISMRERQQMELKMTMLAKVTYTPFNSLESVRIKKIQVF